PDEIRRLAEAMLPITEAAGVGLVVNDHPQIAHAVGAPLCHLGQEDFFDAGHTHVSQVAPAGSGLQVGLSSHAPEQAQRAIAAGAAYVAIGPVYATGTKPSARPVTLDYVRWAAANIAIPWFAIGGITLDNLNDVLAAGARRICVVSAILNAPDIAKACQSFKARLLSAR
ncbi:MAG: thiamine phosphate synthase, partial [Pedosphaera parvula]|nr:thiamine phosphate synthase [Pedosphaera parvula]